MMRSLTGLLWLATLGTAFVLPYSPLKIEIDIVDNKQTPAFTGHVDHHEHSLLQTLEEADMNDLQPALLDSGSYEIVSERGPSRYVVGVEFPLRPGSALINQPPRYPGPDVWQVETSGQTLSVRYPNSPLVAAAVQGRLELNLGSAPDFFVFYIAGPDQYRLGSRDGYFWTINPGYGEPLYLARYGSVPDWQQTFTFSKRPS